MRRPPGDDDGGVKGRCASMRASDLLWSVVLRFMDRSVILNDQIATC
ncbi:hypothetical protein N136_00022 [Leifsonia aquatica ATCC 14665]|uniref:Uncharacterized protein n=1 Tax=Leifsonia aquatica ATCC 14665 TaxID=1358026 RepID=U2RXY4_LEIAQ|nr:hypothetical protein N136_00022 [Leifsonia aquatica ATCC 14665]